MKARLSARLLVTFIGFALSTFAQIDGGKFASDLRLKYGPALARETFTARPGMEMVVDFAANGHVCRIQLPAMGPTQDPAVRSTKTVDEVVLELAPLNMRGKELRRFVTTMSRHSMAYVEYEHVTIAESMVDGGRTGVTVTFPGEACSTSR